MHSLRRQCWTQRLGLYGLAFVFLLQTLAWSGMPVYAADADEGWVVICTNEGFKRLPLVELGITPPESSDTPAPTLIEHCDLCVFAQGLGMAPASAQLIEGKRSTPPVVIEVAEEVFPDAAHSPQQARAPPVHELI